MRRFISLRLAALVAIAVLASATLSAATLKQEHASDASRPRVDSLEDGHVVVSFDLKGDLPGTVTFILERQTDGTLAGTWAATIAYADTTDPATGEEPPPHVEGATEGHHHDFLRLVHRGAMSGAVDSATMTFDASGALTEFNASMSIAQGTLEFTDAAGGTGSASLSQFTLVF